MLLFVAIPALAGTVCPSGCDHADLVSALSAASSGDTVQILEAGSYPAAGLEFPSDDIIVRGEVAGVTLLDASIDPIYRNAMRFERLVIDCGGGRFAGELGNLETLELSWVEVRNCSATSGATATTDHPNSSLSVDNSWLHDLSADAGAVVDNNRGSVLFHHNLFCENSAQTWGGVIDNSANARALVLHHNLFVGNTALQGGGVLRNTSIANVEVYSNTLISGSAPSGMGGGLFLSESALDVHDNLFAYTAAGDAIAPAAPTGTYRNNAFWANLDGDVSGGGGLGADAVTSEPLFPSGTPGCDPHSARPTALALLVGGSGGGEIGAFEGAGTTGVPTAWDDADGDGRLALWDCDDTDPDISDTAPEVACDGKDNDCDGDVDNGATGQGYLDADGDGWGTGPLQACSTDPLVAFDGDCDDADPTVHPGRTDVQCNGVDDDCDPSTADESDADGDLDSTCTDCDDADPLNSSIGLEVCDGQDNDCDGDVDGGPSVLRYLDLDGDGFGDMHEPVFDCAVGVANDDDCDDSDPNVNPAVPEVCDSANRDEDCDGWSDDLDPQGAVGGTPGPVDLDGDGYADPQLTKIRCDPPALPTTDCDDSDDSIFPGATEIPDDMIDQDCDGKDPAYRYGNGSCGCDGSGTPPSTALFIGLLATLATRRRELRGS